MPCKKEKFMHNIIITEYRYCKNISLIIRSTFLLLGFRSNLIRETTNVKTTSRANSVLRELSKTFIFFINSKRNNSTKGDCDSLTIRKKKKDKYV